MFISISWGHVGFAAATALKLLVLNPLLYAGLGLTLWDYSRNGKFERKFFGVRATKALSAVLKLWVSCLMLGVVGSVAAMTAGFVVTSREIALVTGLSILLGLLRLRFLSPIYGISCAIALSLLSRLVDFNVSNAALASWWNVLRNFQIESWLGLLALTMFVQGLALYLYRKHPGFPVAVLSKRGKSIGAFVVRLSFIVPIILPSPGTAVSLDGFTHAWPWLAPQGTISLVALPLLVGHAGLFTTTTPQSGLKRLWVNDLFVAILVGIGVYLSYQFGSIYALAGVVLAIASKEWVLWLMRVQENRSDPLFVPSSDGIRVLSAIKGSLSHAMGLLPGEIITHVNQVPVHTAYDLHFAFDQNPAYAKLQVVDVRGETRFVGNPVYTGERNKLGLILAPDHSNGACLRPVAPGLFQTCYLRLAQHSRSPEEAWLESAAAPPGN